MIKPTKLVSRFLLLILVAEAVPAQFGQSGLSRAERGLTKNVSVKEIKHITKNLADDRFESRGG